MSGHRRLSGWVVFLGLVLTGCGPRGVEFVSEKGGCRVRLPVQPGEQQDLPNGLHEVILSTPSGAFALAFQDLPNDTSEQGTSADRLDRACAGALQRLQAVQLRRDNLTLAGKHQGRELLASWSGGVVRVRLYLVRQRLYHLSVSGRKWWVESADAQTFLDSFTLLEP